MKHLNAERAREMSNIKPDNVLSSVNRIIKQEASNGKRSASIAFVIPSAQLQCLLREGFEITRVALEENKKYVITW